MSKTKISAVNNDVDINLHNALNECFNIPISLAEELKYIIEFMHTASLLIDDIEDESDIRRGLSTAHFVFGMPFTLNSANYAMIYGLKLIETKLCQINGETDPFIYTKASKIYCEQLLDVHIGQGLDIYWRDFSICPTIEEYTGIVVRKTYAQLVALTKLMNLFSNISDSYQTQIENLVIKIGTYFQIRDDYVNLRSNQYQKLKGFAEDISEGKYSYVIILAVESSPDSQKIKDILKSKPKDEETKSIAIDLIEKTGSFEIVLKKLKDMHKDIIEDIVKLGGNEGLNELMDLIKVPDQ